MKSFLMDLLAHLTTFAMRNNQVVGEDKEYFVTLAQLEVAIKQMLVEYDRRTN
jgi:ABC-type transporter Mla subunit MlaD